MTEKDIINHPLLFEDHPTASLIYCSADLSMLRINRAAKTLYGRRLENLDNTSFLDLFADPVRDSELYFRQRDDKPHPVGETLWEHQCQQGLVFLELIDCPIDFRGKPARLVVAQDKTDKLQSDRDARESERALLQLLSDSPDPILALNLKHQIRYANPAAERALNLDPSQLGMRKLPLPDNDSPRFEWTWEGGEKPVIFDVVRSVSRWNGEAMALLSLRDITERKRTDNRLRLLERSLASTRNGVVIVDALEPDQPITYVNPAFERITGYSQEEACGRNCRFLQGSDTDQPAVGQLRTAISNLEEINVVVKNYRKDGMPFWNDLYIAPVPDNKGVVTHFVGIQHDISKQRHYEDTLAYNAGHDALTNLPNRSLLSDRLVQGMQIAQRYQRTLAVMYIDLDAFKPINDLLGHQRGDQILIEVGHRLGYLIRPGDTLARISSDEYVILLPDLAIIDDALHIAEHVLMELARPYWIDGNHYHLTASIGIASSQGSEDSREDPMMLVRQADLAMYQSKQAGGNTYQWYTDELNHDIAYKLQLRGETQNALDNNAFELHFQPKISLSTGQITGLEALIRWQHPQLGLISPNDFIPLAESTGQILAISDWVLEAACRARLRLNQAGKPLQIAINLSPALFRDRFLADRMIATVKNHGLECQNFELEILESVMVGQFDQSLDHLNTLRNAGFALAIDDFGTGFSSLNYLKNLPIQSIKIDRSFIKEIIHDQADAAIVRATISMAHHLGLKVVAEGVETEPQSAFLKRERCDEVQGFLHSRALPMDELFHYFDSKKEADSRKTPESRLGGRNLLIVDDDPYILKSLSRAFRGQGYQTLLANSAADAFVMLAQIDIQVILSDQRMPEMSGTEFFSRVKSLYPDTVRIVLSGYTDLNTVTEAINQGAIYKFLTKPWDDEELRNVISEAFDTVYQRKDTPE